MRIKHYKCYTIKHIICRERLFSFSQCTVIDYIAWIKTGQYMHLTEFEMTLKNTTDADDTEVDIR